MRTLYNHINMNVCVRCGYRPCRCPFYSEDDKYDIVYDEVYMIDDDSEDY